MYKAALIALCSIVIMGCDKKNSECESKICTEVFMMVNITFTKSNGMGVAVENFSVVNQRTGDTLSNVGPAPLDQFSGSYVVASDNHIKMLSKEGDELKITGTYSATKQAKSAIIKVAGGACACHISKISGPDKITFD